MGFAVWIVLSFDILIWLCSNCAGEEDGFPGGLCFGVRMDQDPARPILHTREKSPPSFSLQPTQLYLAISMSLSQDGDQQVRQKSKKLARPTFHIIEMFKQLLNIIRGKFALYDGDGDHLDRPKSRAVAQILSSKTLHRQLQEKKIGTQ